MPIPLGAYVQDRITGFTGRVTGYVQYITGCNQALVVPWIDERGALVESHWFDEQRLIVYDSPCIVLDNGSSPGFDKAPPRR